MRRYRHWVTFCVLVGCAILSPCAASFTPIAGPLSSWCRTGVHEDTQRLYRHVEVLSIACAERVEAVRYISETLAPIENQGIADFLENAAAITDFLMTAAGDGLHDLFQAGIWNERALQWLQIKTRRTLQHCLLYCLSLPNEAAAFEHAAASDLARACYQYGEAIAASWQAHGEARAAGRETIVGARTHATLQQRNAAVAQAKSDLDCAHKLNQAAKRSALLLREFAALNIERLAAYACYGWLVMHQRAGDSPLENAFSQRLGILESALEQLTGQSFPWAYSRLIWQARLQYCNAV